ncbi:MAG TPA: hypothetical protein VLS48_05885 [Anaerolineales bacterium]|nr:hypothetical protein [Anaerolineales bacterium]
MPIVAIYLPPDISTDTDRPSDCPYCSSPLLQRWGPVKRSYRDAQHEALTIFRYRCTNCERTFRYNPQSASRINRSHRVRRLAALMTAMGLSTRQVAKVFAKLGLSISRTSIWRDARELIADYCEEGKIDLLQRYMLDSEYQGAVSHLLGVVLVLRMGTNQHVIAGTLNEHNPHCVQAWLLTLLEGLEIEVKLLETKFLQLNCSTPNKPSD